MNCLLDTHFVLWVVTSASRLEELAWIHAYRPWGLSPISLLEIQFLCEVGRLELDPDGFRGAIDRDPRFVVDDPGVETLVGHALALDWTRDPFDRLLSAHSRLRRLPLVTLDRTITAHHVYLPDEVREHR